MVNLSEEEIDEAIERLEYFEPDDLIECAMYRDCVETIKNLIEKQQKEIEELKWKCNNKYYHTIKCRELEKEINNGWKDKINKLKEEVETEQISNPYDFSYLLNELLEEE
jgi:hypothetical protein